MTNNSKIDTKNATGLKSNKYVGTGKMGSAKLQRPRWETLRGIVY